MTCLSFGTSAECRFLWSAKRVVDPTFITTADTAPDALTMVQCVTFEIRWHNTLPIYSCSFQPISAARLTQVLDHNLGQGTLACVD